MFDYKYTVKSSDGYEWGLFKTKAVATLLSNALSKHHGSTSEVKFWVEEIK
jgi:hypothetical protein